MNYNRIEKWQHNYYAPMKYPKIILAFFLNTKVKQYEIVAKGIVDTIKNYKQYS
jgi:hypothetical protein